VELAEHVPPHVPVGRPLVALGYGSGPPEILTTTPDGSAALSSLEAGPAARLVELDGGRAEVTRYSQRSKPPAHWAERVKIAPVQVDRVVQARQRPRAPAAGVKAVASQEPTGRHRTQHCEVGHAAATGRSQLGRLPTRTRVCHGAAPPPPATAKTRHPAHR
jgi:hypothetical protein